MLVCIGLAGGVAAHTEAGKFDDAVAVSGKATALAKTLKHAELFRELQANLDLLKQRKPIRTGR